MCADPIDTDQIIGGLVSDVGQDSVDQGLVPLKLVLYCVTEKILSYFKHFFISSAYSISLRISNIYLHRIVVILKTEGEVVVDLEHKRIEQMVSPEHLKVSCDESEPGW